MAKRLKIVDLFCGAGGASEALKRAMEALGLEYDLLAVNHSPIAIKTHRANHPDAVHLCQSIEQVDPKTKVFVDPVTGATFKNTGRIDLLIAAPECTHHSTARGGRPMNDQSRSTPWQVLKWHQELYIDHTLLENVPEFREWGPLGANQRPLKSRKGETYRAFLEALRSLGNKVDDAILNAADYGDPTTRRRLFVMARRQGTIAWPRPTHSRDGGRTLFGGTKKWRAAREVIDWSIQGQSVFDRKRPLSPKTWARILAGLERFGGEELKPFLIVLRNNADARSLDRPLPTISAQGQHFGLVDPQAFIMPVTHGSDGSKRERSVDDPLPTITGANRGELAVCEPFIVTPGGANLRQPRSAEEPLPTVTCSDRLAVVEPFILATGSNGAARPVSEPTPTIVGAASQMVVEPIIVPNNNNNRAKTLDEPLPTVTGGGRHMLIEPFVLQQQSGGVARPVDQPLPTIACDGAHMLIEPFLVGYHSEKSAGEQRRVQSVDEPLPTLTTENRFAVVEAEVRKVGEPFIVPPRGFSEGAVDSVDRPLRTIVAASGHNFAVVQPFLVPHFGERPTQTPRTHSVDQPVPTIAATGRIDVVQPFIVGAGGPTYSGRPKSIDEPMDTVVTDEHKALVEPAFIASYYGTQNISPVTEPVPTVTTRDRFALVLPTVNGKSLDIKLRMLKPHELARAMSFGDDYQFAGNQGERVKQIGNAIPCRLGQALIETILERYATKATTDKRRQLEVVA